MTGEEGSEGCNMKDQERIRLLLIDGGRTERASYISNGMGNLLGQWPNYLTTVVWCCVSIVTLFLLITIFSIAVLLNERFMIPHGIDKNILHKMENEFCKRATSKEIGIAGRSVMHLTEPDLQIQDTSENIFYSLSGPLDQREACGVESVLRLCPDKLVYLIRFDNNVHKRAGIYETILKRTYSNLNEIAASGPRYVRASPFENLWNDDNASLLASDLLTVWQFGGTALSPNLIMMKRELLDLETHNCYSDREFLFCPEQCSPYVYELISTLNKHMTNQRKEPLENVIDKSMGEFCGSGTYSKSGCAGVIRVDEALMCTTLADHCLFIRSKEWSDNFIAWKQSASQFCPRVMSI